MPMLLIQFIIFNVLNVIIQTIKSIVTIKCGKLTAALTNAVAYGLYTYIIILTNVELELWIKIIVVAIANLVGVYAVKLWEEKTRKDKLWRVDATVDQVYTDQVHYELKIAHLPHNYIENVGKYTIFNIYCETKQDSIKAKKVLDSFCAKYFVSESKIL